MSETIDKIILQGSVKSLCSFIRLKDNRKPTTRMLCELDRSTNGKIREQVLDIRRDKCFTSLILEGQSHEEFLDVWEQLEYFTNKWGYPYQVLNDMEYAMELEDLNGIQKDLQQTSFV